METCRVYGIAVERVASGSTSTNDDRACQHPHVPSPCGHRTLIDRPRARQDDTTTAVVALQPDPEAVIELELWRTRWTLRAEIGGATRRLLLDSGTGITLVSAATAKAAGCVP